jgi:long-chain acyl-CoA synthetase
MYHAAPGVHAQVALQAGLEIHLQPRFDAEDTLRRIARDRISHFHLVPTMMSRLLRLPEEVKWRYDVSAIRHVTHGAAPCPIDVKNALLDWWGPVLHEYYGSTETSVVCWATPEDARMRPGTVGKALPEMEVRIFDDARRALPPRAIGEVGLHNKLAANFIYHRDEEKRKEVAAGDFVLTGDVGWLDEDGYLFLCDRKRDMVIVGGSNVYPAEIEMILATMPGVYDSAVFGIPDDDLGEVLAALVQPEMGVALDEHSIREFLVPRVARFKLPRRVVITDALPREDTGKIFKRKLRDAYWAGRSRKI